MPSCFLVRYFDALGVAGPGVSIVGLRNMLGVLDLLWGVIGLGVRDKESVGVWKA